MSDPDLPPPSQPIIEHEPESARAMPPPRVVRRGGTPFLVTLLLFAALGGGLYWVWTNPMPQAHAPEPDQSAASGQVAALSGQVQGVQQGQADLKQALAGQIQALTARVEKLEQAPAPQPAAAPAPAPVPDDQAKQQLADLGAKLDALAAKEQSDAQAAQQAAQAAQQAAQQKPQEPPPAPAAPDHAALDAVATQAHNDTQGQIAALGQHTDEAVAQAKSAAEQSAAQQKDALAKEADQQKAALDQQAQADAAARIALAAQQKDALDKTAAQQKAALEQQARADAAARDALAARIGRLEQGEGRVSGEAAKTAHAIRVEQAAVALETGQPLGDVPDAPPALAAYATKAPPTEAGLRADFPRVADAVKAASRPEAAKTTFLDRALARVQQSVTVRRGDHVIVGDPAAGIVARAQDDVANGDLAGAVHALSALEGSAAAAASDWVAQARGLLAARAALASLSAHG